MDRCPLSIEELDFELVSLDCEFPEPSPRVEHEGLGLGGGPSHALRFSTKEYEEFQLLFTMNDRDGSGGLETG